jgi:serine/threonine protein kinase
LFTIILTLVEFMNETLDAAGMAEMVVRLRLVDESIAKELLFELGDKKGPAEPYVRLLERKGLLTPLQGNKLLKGETDGYFVGGYRLLYRIASGSFGRVYRGDDPSTGRTVAIKILRRRWTEDPRRVELFEREGRLGLSLQHPNIVSILAVGKDEATGSHYLVMEFVEGGNLRDILQIRKKMDIPEGLRIMEECAAGLAFAWQRGLSHRDIKPSNILLGTDGVAKLVDFGLAGINEGAALLTTARPGETTSEDAQGMDRTVDYAGLEKATGVKSGDPRSDIYFLGHVLYELLTGEPLMPPTKDRHQRMQRRRFEEVETNLARRAATDGLPAPVRNLIAKAVAFEPSRRYQTPEQFYEAVKATRQELAEGKSLASNTGTSRITGPVTIFVIEQNTKLQDVFREKLKQLGFRVLISIDPAQALKRYKQAPYHALVIDAGMSNRSAAVDAFQQVCAEAAQMHDPLAAILILNEEDAAWSKAIADKSGGTILVRPVTMKQLAHTLLEKLPQLSVETAEQE